MKDIPKNENNIGKGHKRGINFVNLNQVLFTTFS